MNRNQLIDTVRDKVELSRKDVEVVVHELFFQLSESLKSGERVQIAEFGVFESSQLAARTVRNPKTGETVTAKPRRKVRFAPAKSLKEIA